MELCRTYRGSSPPRAARSDTQVVGIRRIGNNDGIHVTNLQLAILALLFFVANSTVARAENQTHSTNVIFADIGSYIQAHGTVHVAIELDFQFMAAHCETLKKPTYSEHTFTTNSSSVHRYIRTLARSIQHVCADVEQLSAHPAGHHHRFERQLGIGVAVSAITSIFALYEVNKVQDLVENLQGEQRYQATLIRHAGSRLAMLETRSREVDRDLTALTQVAANITSNSNAISYTQQQIAFVGEFASDVGRGHSVLQELRRGRLSPLLLNKTQAAELLSRVQTAAQRLGGQAIVEQEEDLFQLPVSVVSTSPFKYTVLVHVAVAKELRRLYRYLPSPIVLRQGDQRITLLVEPVRKLLAHNDNSHQELAEEDLAACQRQGNTYVCDGPVAFHTQLRRSCLGSLFANDLGSMRDHCPIIQSNISWTAQTLGNNEVALFFAKKTSLQMLCPPDVRRILNLEGHGVIKLPTNCSLSGLDLRINSRSDILLRMPVATHPQWDTADLLDGRTPQEIIDIRTRLLQRSVQPAEAVHKMLLQEEALRREIDGQVHSSGHNVGLYVVALIVLVIVGAVVYRYGKLYCGAARAYMELKTINRGPVNPVVAHE